MSESKKPHRRNTPDPTGQGSKDKDASKNATDAPPKPAGVTPPSARWESDHDLARTLKMDNAPVTVPRPAPRAARVSEAPKSDAALGIELLVIDEKQTGAGERRPWRAAEVWTKRRVYGLDSTFRCVEILDRESGRPELSHEMLGARLGGGRMRDKEGVRFSYPLPLAGMEAMFSKGKKHGYTSAVERMVVRIRVLHTTSDETAPSWDDIASRWSEPPPRP